jgi:spoIIIJ-associated protein
MSETSLEATGKSVDEAIERGLAELGLTRDAVAIHIVREGSRGLLGIGSEEALVRLTPLGRPDAPDTSQAVVSEPRAEPSSAPEDWGAVAKQALETLLTGMGLRAHVQVLRDMASEDERALVLNIVGDDLGILIGRRGETLRDLEYLTRLLVAQKTGKPAKLVVDVEGYRTRRERVLNELAKRMADRVQSNRQPITLEAMPPNERRIVHIALRDHPAVTTQSIGEGDHRRVMILPK